MRGVRSRLLLNETGSLFRRVQPIQVSGPVKNTAIGCDEPVPAQRGGNDQAVGRVSMQFCQKARLSAAIPIAPSTGISMSPSIQ